MQQVAGAMPIIVSNYAKLFGIKVRMQGLDAYTNGEVINIPRLNLKDPLVARYAYGYLAHEAAHCRYTDFKVVQRCKKQPLLFALFNILEDSRVEKLIGREFVGVWENLELMRQRPDEWQRFLKIAEKGRVIPLLLGYIMTFAAIHIQKFVSQAPRLEVLAEKLSKTVPDTSLAKVREQVLSVDGCGDSKAVEEVAGRLYALILSGGFFKEDCNSAGLSGADALSQDTVKSDLKLKVSAKDGAGDCPQFLKKGAGLSGPRYVEEFEKLLRRNKNSLDRLLPGADPKSLIESFKDSKGASRDDYGVVNDARCGRGSPDFIKHTQNTYALRRILSQKAASYCNSLNESAPRGLKLDVRKAALLPLGERRIFKLKSPADGMSTAVHLLVDASGSMMCEDGGTKTRALEAAVSALSVALALQNVDGVSTEVTYFPGEHTEYETALYANERACNVAARFDQSPRGSTPLAQALWFASGRLMRLEHNRRIIVVITDGIPDSVEQARLALKYASRCKIEVYGIGIRLGYVRDLFPKSEVITGAAELPGTLFRLFDRLFVIPSA